MLSFATFLEVQLLPLERRRSISGNVGCDLQGGDARRGSFHEHHHVLRLPCDLTSQHSRHVMLALDLALELAVALRA